MWTVPNALSISRLLLFGWFVYELFYASNRVFATLAIALAGCTDYLDGYIARRFHQVSDIGRFLDPAVDRLMTIGTLISVMVASVLPLWLGIVILVREASVSAGALVVASRGLRQIQVSFVGKAGTFGLMCSLPLFIYGTGPGSFAHVVAIIGWIVIVPSVVLAFASAIGYLPNIRSTLRPLPNS